MQLHEHSLPRSGTPLIGRERELATAQALLQREDVRILTLTGPGGTGKTRLAVELASELAQHYQHGAVFVSLAAVADPGLVVSAVAEALGIKESGLQPLLALVSDYLADKELLLLLDNFDQVVAAGPLISDILTRATRLKVLVTSRIVLHLARVVEHTFAVPPLGLPSIELAQTPAQILAAPAVRLFVERATQQEPRLALGDEHIRGIAELCHQLDGLPLAIELAAAHASDATSPARLKQLHDYLSVSAPGAELPARQQTLRTTIDWSYGLLEQQERLLLRRLAVFVGGCTLESAEQVCAGAQQAEDLELDVLDGMDALCDKSLLQLERGTGKARFAMLGLIRDYALEQLEQSGESAQLRLAHLGYFRRLAEQIETNSTANLKSWLEQLRQEHDNIRAALAWALEQGHAEQALQIGAAIWKFWQINGHLSEGRRWLESSLAHPAAQRSAARPKALAGAGWIAYVQGDRQAARRLFEEGQRISEASGETTMLARALHGIGIILRDEGDYEGAREAFEQTLLMCPGDREHVAWTLQQLGGLAFYQRDWERAEQLLVEGLRIFRELHMPWPIAEQLILLGQTLLEQQVYQPAREHFEQALAIYRELDDQGRIARAQLHMGHLELALGQVEEARACYHTSLALYQSVGNLYGQFLALERLAELACSQHDPLGAALLWGACERIGHEVSAPTPPDQASCYRRCLELPSPPDQRRFAQRWDEGRSLPLEQVIERTLGNR